MQQGVLYRLSRAAAEKEFAVAATALVAAPQVAAAALAGHARAVVRIFPWAQ
jgi:hypothetical protein